MKPVLKTSALAATAIFGLSASSQAAILAEYNFPSGSAVATTTGAGVTANNFQSLNGGNDGAAGIDIGFSSGGTTYLRSDATGSTQAAALLDDDYFSVTISATTPGQTLNLTSLTLTLGGSAEAGSGLALTNEIYLLSSVDSFGSVITGTGTTASINLGTASVPYDMNTADSTSFDLSAPAYQGLSSITFNFRVSDSVTLDARLTRFDDVTINGTVVVPEPSAALLGGLGLLALLRRRR